MLLIYSCLIYRFDIYCNVGLLYTKFSLNSEVINSMIRNKIGNRIRELRLSTGLSQEKFAYKIGMDRTYFASVELGKRNISIVNLEKIANGLNIPLSELFKEV